MAIVIELVVILTILVLSRSGSQPITIFTYRTQWAFIALATVSMPCSMEVSASLRMGVRVRADTRIPTQMMPVAVVVILMSSILGFLGGIMRDDSARTGGASHWASPDVQTRVRNPPKAFQDREMPSDRAQLADCAEKELGGLAFRLHGGDHALETRVVWACGRARLTQPIEFCGVAGPPGVLHIQRHLRILRRPVHHEIIEADVAGTRACKARVAVSVGVSGARGALSAPSAVGIFSRTAFGASVLST